MIQPQPTLEQLKQALRCELCATCPFRAATSEPVGPDKPLPCEPKCPVFVHLPLIQAMNERLDPLMASHEHAVNSTIRQVLDRIGEESAEPKKDSAPLTHHQRRIAEILGRLLNP